MAKAKTTSVAQQIFRLGKTTKKLEKVEIAKKLKGDEVAEQVVYHALNPYWTYGVLPKKIQEIPSIAAAKKLDTALTKKWPKIREVLNSLINRDLTGTAARESVESFGPAAPIVERILAKDLRCGAHVSTFNEAMGRNWLLTFDVALADEGIVIIGGKIVQNVDIDYPIWAEPKYDGIRTIAVNASNEGLKLFSRKGKEFENFKHTAQAILANDALQGMMLDGEVFGATFDAATTVAHTKKGKDDKALMYRVWDCMLVDEFRERRCERPLWERQKMLGELLQNATSSKVMQAPGCLIQNEDHLLQVFANLRAEGYEGVILKPLDSMYSYKRSKDWIKVKEMFADEFMVTGFHVGKGKYAKTLGALVIRVGKVNVEVGSGFTDAQRKDIWKNRKKYLGTMVEVKYQEKTKDGSLRFPTFLRWRPDKD